MESDIEYLISRLNKIDGFGDTGDSLLGIVKSKKPEKKPEPEPAKQDDKPESPKPGSEEKSGNAADTGEAKEKATESK